jgi:ribosome recycling factor
MLRSKKQFILALLLIPSIAFTQDPAKIDSLNKLLARTKQDTIKVELLNQLFLEHYESDTALAREIASESFKLSRSLTISEGFT